MARAKPRSGTGESNRSESESKAEKAAKIVSDEENGDNEENDDGEEGDGEEFEIEAILDAKRGVYPDGRMAYFVKWKGYDDSENSWVDEKDAVGAVELVEEYWKKQKKGRKSLDPKARKPGKSVADSAVESESESPAPKKRGRKSKGGKADSDDEKEEEDARSAKKSRKTTSAVEKKTAGKKDRAALDDMEVDEDEAKVGTMKKYASYKSWEDLISTIDTVERNDDDDTLYVFFTLSTGEQVKEKSEICGEKFPRKLIKFYESNLRWRSSEDIKDQEA